MSNSSTLTWTELLARLKEAKEAAKTATGGDLEKNELDIHILQIERQINFAGFDSLAPITAIPHTDLTALDSDVAALKAALAQDSTGTGGWKGILGSIAARAKGFIPIIGGLL